VDEKEEQQSAHFWLIVAIILLFCAVLKLPTLTTPHDEPDEQVYWQLASKLSSGGPYNLQGTEILTKLSPAIYDHSLFRHPPLYPALLVPFVWLNARHLAVMVSWLGHFLCIIAVAVMGRRLAREQGAPGEQSLLFWLPVLGVALDPFLTFVSGKLWIDGLLAGLCSLAIACFYCARFSPKRPVYLLAGGILFGLACLTKLPALALAPIIGLLILKPKVGTRLWLRDLSLGCVPAIVLIVPWFVIFHRAYGAFMPDVATFDAWTLEHYPFVVAAVNRNPTYYIAKIIALTPASVFCLVTYLLKRDLWKKLDSVFPCLWFLLFFAALSWVGMRGQGFQMRFLAPLFSCIYLMLYAVIREWRGRSEVLSVALLLCLVYAGLNGVIYLLLPQYDEIRPVFTIWGTANL
jgi:4-amino-4-deoxy-L-arabinose transferase-like glycosyltransferase